MKIISHAQWLGMDEQRRQRAGTGVVIEVDGVRFFSLTARDEDEADRLNAAADKLVNQGRVFHSEG